jgi:hypothetical protein
VGEDEGEAEGLAGMTEREAGIVERVSVFNLNKEQK